MENSEQRQIDRGIRMGQALEAIRVRGEQLLDEMADRVLEGDWAGAMVRVEAIRDLEKIDDILRYIWP